MPRFRWPYGVTAALYCAGIFYLSAQPSLPDQAPSWLDRPGVDKAAHAILYAGLAFVIYTGLVRSDPNVAARVRRWGPILFATLYGLSDEIHQLFVPNRSFDVWDLLADAVGATIGVVALEFRRRKRADGGTPAPHRP